MGLKVMFSWEKKGAMFLALDGYHHHVGANLWKGVGLPPAPDDAIGLVEYTWKADADQIPDLRLKLEARGYPTHDKEKGFFVKDNSGIGIAVIGV